MNNKLRKAFAKNRSYFKQGCDYLCNLLSCTAEDIQKFRNTPWYKENRRAYCSI